MNVLDLFSGIGGFSLGLERAGMRTVAFCEIEPYARAVLAERWPGVPIYEDVRELTGAGLAAAGIRPDLICGGFPCQDISVAGRRVGIDGERSGLWSEFARLIGEIRPRYAIVENVAALLGRGIGRVLGDLSALGYDAEWHVISAADVGAPHLRERVWIVAYPVGERLRGGGPRPAAGEEGEVREEVRQQRLRADAQPGGEALAHADRGDLDGRGGTLQMGWGWLARQVANDGDAGRAQWGVEPDVGRVAHGIPARVDRLCGLGNAVVPQIPEIIGRAILATDPLIP